MRRILRTASCGSVVALCLGLMYSASTAAEYAVSLAPGESISAASGAYAYTLQLIDPTIQTQPTIDFTGPYYHLLLTNDAAVPDSFHLEVDNLTQPTWFSQVCLRSTCYPESTTLGFGAGVTDTIGVDVIPFSDGVGEWDFYLNSVGDLGLNDTIHMTLYAGTAATATPEVAALTGRMELRQNAPNPVVDRTAIAFSLAREEPVSLGVYDVAGRLVAMLDSGVLPAGPHTVRWDGRSDTGTRVSGGVYFYRLQTPSGEISRRLTLVR
jgi:FlgD Ig-like domain